jgi:hypothetical protein
MTKKSKTQEILKGLLRGEKMTVKSCMRDYGTFKLSSRLGELEKKYGFLATRKMVKSKSRYGGIDEYMEYSLSQANIKLIKKELLK